MKKEKEKEPEVKIVARNRRAHQRFFVLESLEAGMSLQGHEVKSLRQGKAVIEDGLVRLDNHQAYLFNVHIPPYPFMAHVDYDPVRSRRLLLHRQQIERLSSQVQLKGLTLVPLELYFKRGIAKVSVGLCKGKKTGDQREVIKKREAERDIRRNVDR